MSKPSTQTPGWAPRYNHKITRLWSKNNYCWFQRFRAAWDRHRCHWIHNVYVVLILEHVMFIYMSNIMNTMLRMLNLYLMAIANDGYCGLWKYTQEMGTWLKRGFERCQLAIAEGFLAQEGVAMEIGRQWCKLPYRRVRASLPLRSFGTSAAYEPGGWGICSCPTETHCLCRGIAPSRTPETHSGIEGKNRRNMIQKTWEVF